MDAVELRAIVKRALPEILDGPMEDVVTYLISKGVKRERDLRHFTVAMLEPFLDLVDASELHEAWQKDYATNTVPPVTSEPGCSNSGRTSSSRNPLSSIQTSARRVLSPEFPQFDSESPLFPAEVRAAILAQKRPPDNARVVMTERIVDYCREKVSGFARAHCKELALNLVTLYPKSFKDTLPVSSHGSDSLAKQLAIRFDNEKRPHKPSAQEKTKPASKEAYGCQQYNPPLPDDETVDSLLKKRDEMKQMYKMAKRDWDWRSIKKKMEQTFYLQRQDIISSHQKSAAPSKKRKRNQENVEESSVTPPADKILMPQIKENWPFLFTCTGMNIHFELLTGVDFESKFVDFVRTKGSQYVDFLSCRNEELSKMKRRMDKATRVGCGSATTVALILMLIKHFGDERTALVRYVEPTTTFEELTTAFTDFPSDRTPFLVAAGSSLYEYNKLFLAVDNQFLCSVSNITGGFTMLFSAYFAFNIAYSEKLVNLLNFTQRVVAEICEAKGTKCSTSQMNRRSNDKVVRLVNKFTNYLQKLEDEEQDSN